MITTHLSVCFLFARYMKYLHPYECDKLKMSKLMRPSSSLSSPLTSLSPFCVPGT